MDTRKINILLEVNELNSQALKSLANNEILAIRVKNYISQDLSKQLTTKILGAGFDSYRNAPSIGRIGMAYYEAENKKDLLDEYFSNAINNINDLRRRCAPFLSPIDQIRCQLDELWPAGAKLETLFGRKMFVGLSRVVKPGTTFLAHHDIFSKDAPDCYRAQSLSAQFACNVYLKMPKQGGELMMWKKEIQPDDFDQKRQENYGLDVQTLGKPDLKVNPNEGDLMLFNSKKMHAVKAGIGNERLSLSCFVGYRGEHQSLSLWS